MTFLGETGVNETNLQTDHPENQHKIFGKNKRKRGGYKKNKQNMSQKQSKTSLRTSELPASSAVKTNRVINGVSRMLFGHEDNAYLRNRG